MLFKYCALIEKTVFKIRTVFGIYHTRNGTTSSFQKWTRYSTASCTWNSTSSLLCANTALHFSIYPSYRTICGCDVAVLLSLFPPVVPPTLTFCQLLLYLQELSTIPYSFIHIAVLLCCTNVCAYACFIFLSIFYI